MARRSTRARVELQLARDDAADVEQIRDELRLKARVARHHVEPARDDRPGRSCARVISCVHPSIAFSGVRSSCETIATKSSLSAAGALGFRARRALGFEQPLPLGRGALLIADVARDLRGAHHAAGAVAHRRHGQRHVEQPPVLGAADGLEVLDTLALAEASPGCRPLPPDGRRE